MKKSIFSLAVAGSLFTMLAIAQPATSTPSPSTPSAAPAPATSGPAPVLAPSQPGRFTGPSAVTLMTIKQLLATGKNEQYAKIQGRIVSHERDENYTFVDGSGTISVEISPDRFPPGQNISPEQRVELSGELDKDWHGTEFEVKHIRLLP